MKNIGSVVIIIIIIIIDIIINIIIAFIQLSFYLNCSPSKAPSELILSAVSSTSITASWQLPPAYSRHGIIAGFKLFYKKKGFIGSIRVETINDGRTFLGVINGLDKYTEYEFQVLAFTSHGDGPKSSVVVERTMEDGKKLDCL